jgi:hypothetical protein
MTNEPTPETDAIFRDNVPDDAQIAALLFCERLERERNAARAERDALSEALERNCVQYVQKQQAIIAERDELRRNCETLNIRCQNWHKDYTAVTAEHEALRADVARLRTALEGIAEYGKLCSDGDATDCARLIYLAKQALNAPAQ